MRTTFVVTALLLLAVPAHAERKRRGGLPPADRVHDFHSVDRLTPQTTFGFELGFESVDSDNGAFLDTAIGFDVSGHFVSDMGAGGYVVIPLSYISVDPPIIEGDSETMIGNIEVGGLYAAEVGQRTDVLFHLGVALPTASDDELIHGYQPFASTPRYGDLVQRWPNSTWLRLGVSPMGTFGPMFYRVDLGLDLMLDDDDDTGADISPVLRVNLAGGVDFGQVDATVELATNVTDPDDDNADETASTLAIGARFDAGTVFPGLALIFPVGFDDLGDAIDLAVAVSLTARIE